MEGLQMNDIQRLIILIGRGFNSGKHITFNFYFSYFSFSWTDTHLNHLKCPSTFKKMQPLHFISSSIVNNAD
jgi:hypothetical protein